MGGGRAVTVRPDGQPEALSEEGDAAVTPRSRTGIGRTAVRIGVSMALLWLVLRQVDPDAAAARLVQAKPGWLLFALLLLAVQVAILSWRWSFILRYLGFPIPVRRALALNLAGFFIGQALPTSIGGDAWRIWRLRSDGCGVGLAAKSVVLDRIVALFALLVVTVAAMPWLLAEIETEGLRLALQIGTATGGLLLVVGLVSDRLVGRRFGRWSAMIARLAWEMRALTVSSRGGLALVALSVAVHATVGVIIHAIARGFGMDIGLVDCIILMPPITLVAGLPFSLAGWGVREGAMIAMFGLIGVGAADALLLSVVFGLLLIMVSLPGALVLLFARSGANVADRPPGDRRP